MTIELYMILAYLIKYRDTGFCFHIMPKVTIIL